MSVNYTRQHGLQGFDVPQVATVIGTGAVGCWLAYFAALAGTKRLILYTIGNVKPSDIARFPFPADLVATPYSVALAKLLCDLRPELELIVKGEFRPESDPLEGVVFNCAASEYDDFDVRLYDKCLSNNLRYFTGYYTGHTVYVADHVTDKLPRPSLDPVPAWVGSAALAGLQVFYTSATYLSGPLLRSINLASGACENSIEAFVADKVAR